VGKSTRGSGAMLCDVLEVAVTLATCKQSPELLCERIGALKSAARLELDAAGSIPVSHPKIFSLKNYFILAENS